MKKLFTKILISLSFVFAMTTGMTLHAQCEAGTLVTTGSLTICEGGTFDVYSTGSDIPGGGTYGWIFRNTLADGTNTGGTGANVQNPGEARALIIPGSVLQTLDADLGGLLSANNLPPFFGTWIVTGATSSNLGAPGASQCSETSEFLEVTFTADPSHNVTLNENGPNLSSTVGGGTMPYTYEWSDGSIESSISEAIANELYCLTVTDAGACHVTSCAVFSEQCEAGTLLTTGMITVCKGGTFDLAAETEIIPIGGGYGWYISNESTDGTGGTQGPIFLGLSETVVSYNADLNGVLAANNLGPLTGTWVFYGSTYSDASDFNTTRCSNTIDSLVVTFVDTPAPEVVISAPDASTIVLQVTGGESPYTYAWSNGATTEGLEGITENGDYTVTVTDSNGCQQVAGITVYPNCDAGTMTNKGFICVSGTNTFDVGVDNPVIPNTGGLAWFITNQNSDGTGGTGGQVFLNNADPMVTWDNDLGGLLTFNSLPPLEGTWVIYAVVYGDGTDFASAATSDCSISTDSLVVSFVAEDLAVSIADDNNTLTATGSGGDGPYTYLWSSGEMSESITVTETGTYTVTITDSNSCVSASNSLMVVISGTDQIDGLSAFAVTPNPTKGDFDLKLRLENTENIHVQLVSLTGQVVKQVVSETSNGGIYNVAGEDLAAGMYLLQVTVSGQTINEKVLITK